MNNFEDIHSDDDGDDGDGDDDVMRRMTMLVRITRTMVAMAAMIV